MSTVSRHKAMLYATITRWRIGTIAFWPIPKPMTVDGELQKA